MEERHNDEWLLEDYTVMGGDPAELVGQPGTPTVAALVGSIYYWCLHAHPVAILGLLRRPRGLFALGGFINKLEARTGYPHRAFMTLHHHSDIDVDHSAKLFDLIDSLPLIPSHEALIGMTPLQTADLLIGAADELLERSATDDAAPGYFEAVQRSSAQPSSSCVRAFHKRLCLPRCS